MIIIFVISSILGCGLELARLRRSEVVVRRGSVGKLFLETSQNSPENTCARVSFLIKFQVLGLQLY